MVRALHAAPQQAVLELAGGTQALAWLHAVGGSSRTVLEATDRYGPASLAELLGAAPEKAVARGVAEAMAAAARRRDRDRHGSWFAAEWLDDRHNLSGVDGLPALALAFARLAEAA